MSSDCCRPAAPTPSSDCCTPASENGGATACQGLRALAHSEHDGQQIKTPIRIMQMDCPTEEGLLRGKLGKMPGVLGLEFNLMQRVLTVTHQADRLEPVLAAIRELGFSPQLTGDAPPATHPPSQSWWPLALAVMAAIGAEILHWAGMANWMSATLALLAIALSGTTTYRKGWVALKNFNLNINALMSIAVTGALLIGQWPEAAMVMVLFSVAELIEARSLARARNAIGALLHLSPEKARVQQADGSWQELAAAQVALDSRVRVLPGERIALDGKIVAGQSSINQSAITGESLPLDKGPGDEVFAGTLNEEGSFEYRVTALAQHSTIARIIEAVEAAQGAHAPIQRFVDQFARIYTPIVFLLALAVAIVPPLLFGGAWLAWSYKALVLLVIACPCALVISTPVTIVSGLAAAARHGILIKGGAYLEAGRSLRWLALDKTGTLTHGRPQQSDVLLLADMPAAQARCLAASLAQHSAHPVSRALSEAARHDEIMLQSLSDFVALPGRGISARVAGDWYQLVNHRQIHAQGLCSDALEAQIRALEMQGKSAVALADQIRVYALFAVVDKLKTNTAAAIDELHALGIKTLMLSGDNAHTARIIAAQAGVDEVHAELLPEDKLCLIEARLSPHGKVGMVGDGINDAPALARADIGFAMGAAGSPTAFETADVALMDDDLRKLPRFVRLSRSTHRVLMQNIGLALGLKLLFLALTLAGAGSMWMAVFADVGASLLVVANGLRLLRK